MNLFRSRFDLFCGALTALMIGANAAAAEPEKYTVHEWGTFSTFSGSDGKNLKFHPNDRDLPAFVHSNRRDLKGGPADVLVSLETPVLYFYSDRDRTVSVQVDFPKGAMTDWYPQASRPPTHSLRWDGIKVLAKDRPKLPGEGEKGRYFAARGTDALPLEVAENDKRQVEKFLFYRGVGDFVMPYTVSARGAGSFDVKNASKSAVPAFVLLRVQDRKVSFEKFGKLDAGAEVRVEEPKAVSTTEKLGDAVAALLVEQGLYEKEARAMVKTWSADWFGEDGIRVLYLVAEPQTAEFLPMKIEPKPEKMVRVMVGRHDVLTPEREKEIDALVKRVNGDSNPDAKVADEALGKLGRYRWASQHASEARIQAGARRER